MGRPTVSTETPLGSNMLPVNFEDMPMSSLSPMDRPLASVKPVLEPVSPVNFMARENQIQRKVA